jgi:NADPH-dependent 2,4-dienoyl-CoA reductase/sulfur reductase-like enzyme
MRRGSEPQSTRHVVVVGAGPYGLSIAAHLRAAGLKVRVFGDVMGAWRRMPAGMLLRSERRGTHIADPHGELTLERYEAGRRVRLPRRLPLADFIAYGLWYQQHAVPDVDPRRVRVIDRDEGRFRLVLDDGDRVLANVVVVATGLEGHAVRPAEFARVPPELAPHSSEVSSPASYAGLRVVVIGAGNSALELAALLHESGASVEVIARRPTVRFLSGRELFRGSPLEKIVYPPGEVGPPGVNWVIQLPDLFRALPPRFRRWVALQSGPVGAAWLRPRLVGVPITAGRRVVGVDVAGQGLRLALDDGTERRVDRVVLGTGYRVDLDRSPILAPSLVRELRRIDGSPQLGRGFESSVPGLYFAGTTACASFGPLMRFVAGTGYTARTIARHIAAPRAASRTA